MHRVRGTLAANREGENCQTLSGICRAEYTAQ